jgi:hypothetical protein
MADQFVNLTGHRLTVYAGGKVLFSLPAAEGMPFRVDRDDLGTHDVAGAQVQAIAVRPGKLPDPEPGAWIVVSQVAALSLAVAGVHRSDVLFPGPGVTDRGRVVGCRGLCWLVVPDTIAAGQQAKARRGR